MIVVVSLKQILGIFSLKSNKCGVLCIISELLDDDKEALEEALALAL